MDGRRVTAYGSMLGVAFGGFTWVVVAGGLIHEPVVSLGGVALGSLVWWFGGRGLLRYRPRPARGWAGLTLSVVLTAWAFLANVLPGRPNQAAAINLAPPGQRPTSCHRSSSF